MEAVDYGGECFTTTGSCAGSKAKFSITTAHIVFFDYFSTPLADASLRHSACDLLWQATAICSRISGSSLRNLAFATTSYGWETSSIRGLCSRTPISSCWLWYSQRPWPAECRSSVAEVVG